MQKMHLISNAHIDPMWQWEWREGAGATISTYRVAADLCEKNPDFIFNHNEVLLYEWIEEYEPDLFRRIQALVREGRWHIMGGWVLQPDCNLPCGESFVRQIEMGLRWFHSRFGVRPTTVINLDSFGHSRGLVQIFTKCGYDSYLITRPNESGFGHRFEWKGFDGSSVRVCKVPRYNSPLGRVDKIIAQDMAGQAGENHGITMWGVGDHGGGPSREDLEKIKGLMASSDVEIVHSTPEIFFADTAGEKLELVEESLRPSMVGCYLSQVRIKQGNHRLESELLSAERMATAAWAAGLMDYPTEELKAAWHDLLFAQFHDILPGSSIRDVEQAGLDLQAHGMEEVRRVKARAFFRLCAGQKGAGTGDLPILVYNNHPFDLDAVVTCEMMLPDQNWEEEFVGLRVFDEEGNELPAQVEKERSNLALEWRKRVVFRATLNAGRMSRFYAVQDILPEKPGHAVLAEDDCFVLSGGKAEIRIGRNTGLVEGFTLEGRSLLRPGSGQLRVVKDSEDPWGMTVTSYTETEGFFRLADRAETARICGVHREELAPVRVIESGAVRTVVEAVFVYNTSRAVARYTMEHATGAVNISLNLQFLENDRMVKMSLLPADQNAELLTKTAFGLESQFTDGTECVLSEYLLARQGADGMSLSGTGGGGYSVEGGDIWISLLHTPAYCAHPIHDRPLLPTDRFSPRSDQEAREFTFQLKASSWAERLTHVQRECDALNQPAEAECFFPGGDDKPQPSPLCLVDNSAVQMSACKKAEDSDDVILRLFNSSLEPAEARVDMPALKAAFTAVLEPLEVAAWRIHGETAEQMVELIEYPSK